MQVHYCELYAIQNCYINMYYMFSKQEVETNTLANSFEVQFTPSFCLRSFEIKLPEM
jgi:hypothetical protein